MKKEIERVVKHALKIKKTNPKARFFVASKRGGNAQGKGANRSVILATEDGKKWYQYYKFWGYNNEEKANEVIRTLNNYETLHLHR